MGLLVNGQWLNEWYDTAKSDGAFIRQDSRYRNWITVDGSAGPTGSGGFKAESGRYHLYVSLACPWAHRTLIMRQLKQLQELVTVTVVDPLMLQNGWEFSIANPDDMYGLSYLYQLYLKNDPSYEGRVTVPVLWDKQQQLIVNNESADIIRMFNSAFNDLTGDEQDFYPIELRADIDVLNADIYSAINNGVYKAGFATAQWVYAEAVQTLFGALDELELRLSAQRYLLGDTLTETDIRLFTTLIRFDPVYVGHFKCNLRTLSSYPALFAYLRDIYQLTDIPSTVNFDHIKRHYYCSHSTINPTGIVPLGPRQNLWMAHGRESLMKSVLSEKVGI